MDDHDDFNWDLWSSDNLGSMGFAPETHPRVSGDDELPNARIASYLAEDNGPLHLCRINATYSQREATRRAVAEIDGMFAGLKYLDKMQKSTIDPLVDDDFGPPSSFDEDWSWPGPEDLFPSDTEHPLFIRELALFGQDAADSIRPDGAGTDPEQPVPPTQPAIDKEKAWEGLLVLRISMRGEFRHFQQAVSKSTSVPLHDLKLCFASSTSLIDRGILVCRDVLAGMVPGTLSEIFAFACLSHAISRILVRRKRMLPNQVLLGLPRWRDCIFDSQEREAFDTLASEMWPSSFCSPAKGDGSDLPGYPVGGATLNTNVPEIQDDASQFLQWPARVISDEMRYGFQPDRDVLPWTTLTGSEFGFHRLQVLEEGTDSHRYAVPQGIDPRDPRFCEPELSIPGYSFCRYSPPIGSAYLSPNIGIASSIPDAPPSSRGLYNFQIDERVSECTAFNLRNTVGFLAVSAFITETGEKFYRLSASGMTVTQGGTGSAFAERRSKAERKLRSEFLGPLKRAGAKDVRFLALLSVAKAFVVLGHLRTEEEVQKYMLQVSEDFFKDEEERFEFTRWIFSRGAGTSESSDVPQPAVKSRKRNNTTDNDPSACSLVSKKPRIYHCEHPGCDTAYQSASGLSKHNKKHENGCVACNKCNYSCERRDSVRKHFVTQHGLDLPDYLRDTRKGYASRVEK